MSRGGSTSLHVNVYIPPLPSRRPRRRSWREKARRSSRARATSPTRRRPRWRSRAQAGEKEFQFDAVGVETERYKFLAPEEVQPYVRNDGLLNEFKMTYAFRHRFPLHYIVFKQTASHLPHKAKVEQALFSRAGQLADPNLDPNYLGMMVMVGMNKKTFKPPLKCMKERYYLMIVLASRL